MVAGHNNQEIDSALQSARYMEALGNTGQGLRSINKIVGTVIGILTSSFAWVVGAKVAGRFIPEGFSQKRKEG